MRNGLALLLVSALVFTSCSQVPHKPKSILDVYVSKAEESFKKGDLEESERLFKAAMEIDELAYAPSQSELPRVLENVDKLAWIYSRQAKFDQAAEQLEKALAIHEAATQVRKKNKRLKEMASLKTQLASIRLQQDRFSEAEELVQEALDTLSTLKSPPDLQIARDMLLMAQIHARQAHYDQAESYYQKALALFQKHPERDVEKRIDVMIEMGDFYKRRGVLDKAQQLFYSAIYEAKTHYGVSSPMLAHCYTVLADYYYSIHDPVRAKNYYFKALAISKHQEHANPYLLAHHMHRVAQYFYNEHNYPMAEYYFKKAFFYYSKVNNIGHPTLARSLNQLGNVYFQYQRYPEAKRYYEKALTIRQTSYGENHLSVAHSYRHLADYYIALGQFEEARRFFDKAIAVNETVFGSDHENQRQRLEWLGDYHMKIFDYPKALDYYQQIHALNETLYGKDSELLAPSLVQLAEVNRHLGHYSQAERLLTRALTLLKRDDPMHFNGLATIYKALSKIKQDQGYYREAEQYYKTAIGFEKRFLADSTLSHAELMELASIYLSQNRTFPVIPIYRLIGYSQQRSFGPEHTILAVNYDYLGQIGEQQFRFDLAQAYYKMALRIRQQRLGKFHPEVATSHLNLAKLYIREGWHNQAADHVAEAMAIEERCYGKDNVAVYQSKMVWADLLRAQYDLAEAQAVYQDILTQLDETLGPTYPGSVELLQKLAMTADQRGDLKQADQMYRQALGRGSRIWGKRSPRLVPILLDLATLHERQHHHRVQLKYLKRARTIAIESLAGDHPHLMKIHHALAEYYHHTGKTKKAKALYYEVIKPYSTGYGQTAPEIVSAFFRLSQIYHQGGRYDAAYYYFFKAHELNETLPTSEELTLPSSPA